jgi:hypothetical protein
VLIIRFFDAGYRFARRAIKKKTEGAVDFAIKKKESLILQLKAFNCKVNDAYFFNCKINGHFYLNSLQLLKLLVLTFDGSTAI